MWLKRNGVYRLRSQSLIDHTKPSMPNWLIEVGVAGGRDTAHTALEIKNDPTDADTFVCPSPTGMVAIPQCSPMY